MVPSGACGKTGEEVVLAAVERIGRAAEAPAVTPDEERAKANGILDALACERLLAIVVPADLGGAGASLATAARAVAAVAQASGSAGLVYAMHLAQLISIVRHGRSGAFRAVLRRLAERQMLVASATSEVGVGGEITTSRCWTNITPDGRFRLAKSCVNISYTDRASAILATAMHEERGRSAQRLVLLERPDFSVRVDREVLFLGMRGILNRAVTIDGVFPGEAIFPEPFRVIAQTMSAASHVLWAAVWAGLAAAALARAQAIAAPQAEAAGPSALRLVAAADRLYVMHALIRDACLDGEADLAAGLAFRGTRFNRLKIVCADLLTEVVAECAVVAGLRGYVEGTKDSLSEIVRDSFSARIMISNDRLRSNNAAVQRYVTERI